MRSTTQPDLESVARETVDAAVKLHIHFGPGLLESVYDRLLACELARRGLLVERQRGVPVEYNGMTVQNAFYVDLLVDARLLVELKSVEILLPVHFKQTLTYLRLLHLPLGLLINFGEATMKHGIHRVVNNYHPQRSR